MDVFRQDLRYALRRLARSPGFTLVAALSLALGIGANTAIFSIVNAVLLRELPVAAPGRLMEIYTSDDDGLTQATSSYPDYLDLRAATTDVFADVIAYEAFFGQVEAGGEPVLVMGEVVTGNYFSALGIGTVLGRGIVPEDDARSGPSPVVVLGHGFWQRALGGDPAAIGSTIRVNRRPYTVIGIAAPEFRGMTPALAMDVYMPMALVNQLKPMEMDRLDRRGSRSLLMKGRLREGVAHERAAAAVAAVGNRLSAAYPESNEGRFMSALPTTDVALHPIVDKVLMPVAALMLAVAGMVLLIACVNLASFLLARAADRRREIAIRLSIGAKRIQLVRQLLIESVTLSLLGGVAGIFLAIWLVGVLTRFQPPIPVPIKLDIAVDGVVLAFTFGVSAIAGVLFGLVPALHATRPDVAHSLKSDAGSVTAETSRHRLRNGLVVAQVAVSLVLLIGSGLFLRSLEKAQAIDPGFDTGPAAILWPNMELTGLDGERAQTLFARMRAALRALPGVTAVGMADRLPIGMAIQTRGITVQGMTPPPGSDEFSVDFTHADAGYFDVMGVPIVAGRNFTDADHAGAPRVAIVSQAFAQRFFPGRDAVGQTFHLGEDNPVQIIGIARDTKVRTLGEVPRPYVYMHALQEIETELNVIVRGPSDAAALLAAARQTVLDLHPELVLMETKTMQQHLAIFLFPPRMAALLLSAFGGLALLLSAVGLYGMVSYTVARRVREMGIRLALGATPGQLVSMFATSGLRLVAVGAVIGTAVAFAASRLIARYLYGIDAADLVTFLGVPAVLGAVGFIATWVPARRATGADPMAALRSE